MMTMPLCGAKLRYLLIERVADLGWEVCDERALVTDLPARQLV
jgi:hypothetical protein